MPTPQWKGTWNASTNTPVLINGTGTVGDFYTVSVGGSFNLGGGLLTFGQGQSVIYSLGNVWLPASVQYTASIDELIGNSGGGGGSGTVTSVGTGTGLTGGPITSTGTISLANTTVTPGSYTLADITVDAQGRITAASSGTGGTGTVTSVAVSGGSTGLTTSGGPITTSGTITLAGTLAITNGGTGVTSVTTIPAANAWIGWDSNKNLTANNINLGYQAILASTSTVYLTVASPNYTLFYGTPGTFQVVHLPDTSTLSLGQTFQIDNDIVTYAVNVYDYSGTYLISIISGGHTNFTCSSTSTQKWDLVNVFINTITTTSLSITYTGYGNVDLEMGAAGTPGTYAYPSSVTTNTYGQVTSITAGSAPTTYTFSTGLTNTLGVVTVNTSQNITTLSNLVTNGIVYASGGGGTLGSGPLSGDVTTTALVSTIAANAVTYAKMQSISATSKLLGSSSTTTPVQEISLGSGLSLSGTTLSATGSGGTVTSVSGTTNRITVATGTTTPVIDISAAYVGQTSITTFGTITTGTLSTGAIIAGVTMTLGSDASYDIYYRNSSGILTRLANGTTNQALIATTSAAPSWGTPALATTVTTNANLTGPITSVGNATSIASQTGTGTKFMVDTDPALTVSTPTTTSVGYLGIPQGIHNANYTTVMTDSGKHFYHTDGSAYTWTIDSNANVAFPIGTTLTFINDASGAANITIAITSDTLVWAGAGTTGSRTIARYGMATAVKVASTKWYINGNGIT